MIRYFPGILKWIFWFRKNPPVSLASAVPGAASVAATAIPRPAPTPSVARPEVYLVKI